MKPWHALDLDETRAALEAGPKDFGPNRLDDREAVRWPVMLARQFQSLLVLILALAAGLSFFIGDTVEALAIFLLIVMNAALGFAQEWKAETALKGLRKMLSPRCRVIRDGREQDIEAERLVPGDCVVLAAGDAVPADVRLSAGTNLKADESALTGESVSVDKDAAIVPEDTDLTDRANMLWMGTHIVNGRGTGLVVATGMDTEFGRIAGLTGSIAETQTGLQEQLAGLARQLGVLALLVSLAVILIGVLGGRDLADMLMTGVSLAVAAVPEGLPAVVTITLALGAGIMARKKALLRRLQAAETLGEVSVICTDKTGTLTKNEMTVRTVWLPGGTVDIEGTGYEPAGAFLRQGQTIEPQRNPGLRALLETGRKCNHARIEKDGAGWRAIGSPTEAALIVAAEKAGLRQEHGAEIVEERSFDSVRKRMSVVEKTADGMIVHVKGAPEFVLPLCSRLLTDGGDIPMTEALRRDIKGVWTRFAKDGLRTLALAHKNVLATAAGEDAEDDLIFLGIVGVIDPPRPEVAAALAKAQRAGIRVIVITGDSPDTALAVAGMIGLKEAQAVTSADMKAMSDGDLSALLTQDVLFARTVPEDKFRIVRLLQAQGQLVAMTGDGVNDAPALKQADIGIAMGIRGTDVARGAADIVLTDDNFASIIAAVEEGRRQYANIRKFVRYLASSNIGETLAIFVNILIGGPLILIPVQILWVNLVTDGVTAVSLSVEKAERAIMDEPPRASGSPILDRAALVMLGLFGSYIGVATLLLFQHYLGHSYELANTVAFTAMVMMANIHALNFRNLSGPVSGIGWFSNPWILLAIAAMLGLQVVAVHVPPLGSLLHIVPLSLHDWTVIAFTALPLFIVPEVWKSVRKRQ